MWMTTKTLDQSNVNYDILCREKASSPPRSNLLVLKHLYKIQIRLDEGKVKEGKTDLFFLNNASNY